MNVSAWSIRNPIPAVLLFLLLTLAGLLAFKYMRIQQFMDIDLPTVTVTASLPGAAPAQMETEVARKIENAIAPLQGLKNIYTNVQDGSVSVTAEFRLEKPTQEAVDDVRSAVQQVRSDLPSDLRDPIVSKMNLAGSPILAYTVRSGQMDDEALSWYVDNTISRTLLGVKGVGSVARVGGVSRQIDVQLDPVKLQALGATAADVSRQLRQVQVESAGGRADLGQGEQPVRTVATVGDAESLAQLQVVLSSGQSVRLADVATVRDTVAEPRALALLNGKPVVGFEITRSKGASEVEVGAAVQVALAELRTTQLEGWLGQWRAQAGFLRTSQLLADQFTAWTVGGDRAAGVVDHHGPQRLQSELVFVDETDHRRAAFPQLRQQRRMARDQRIGRRFRDALPGQVVDGHGDATIGRGRPGRRRFPSPCRGSRRWRTR